MAYPKALDDGEVRRVNLKSIRTWIETNKALIKAKPNKSIVYSGRDYDLEVLKDVPLADRKVFMGTPMWKVLEQSKQRHDLKFPCEFQTLEDVLKSIRQHPQFITRDRQEVGSFANAFEFFSELKDFPKLVPDGTSQACWVRLSEIYTSNAVGDIRILDGVSDSYEKLGSDKVLVNTELLALLKNSKLSPAGKAELMKKIPKYKEHLQRFDKRYEMKIQLAKEVSRLNRR